MLLIVSVHAGNQSLKHTTETQRKMRLKICVDLKINSAMGHILRSVPSELDAVVLRLRLFLTSPFAKRHPTIAVIFFSFLFVGK